MNNRSARGARPSGSAALVRRLAWAVVLIVAVVALALTGFTSRDPDSTVYSEISGRLSALPFRAWMAPDWGGSWGVSGRFREHPFGIFVLPALVGRIGYPPVQAAFAVGALLSIVSLWLVRRVAEPIVADHEASALQWAVLILPIAFVYRIRASQEYPVLALTLFGIYATRRSRESSVWVLGVAGAACALALVKGIFVVFLPAVCALWLLLIRENSSGDSDRPDRLDGPDGLSRPDVQIRQRPHHDVAAWMGLVLAVLAVAALAWAYEWAYQRSTGDSFMSFYLHDRVAANAGIGSEGGFSPAATPYNLVWYLGRLLWFAMPGTLVLLLSAGRLTHASIRDVRSLGFALLASAAYLTAMSLGANKADRFIFPAYFFAGAAGAIVAMRRWGPVGRFARWLVELPPYALPLVWLSLFMLAMATEHRPPYLKF